MGEIADFLTNEPSFNVEFSEGKIIKIRNSGNNFTFLMSKLKKDYRDKFICQFEYQGYLIMCSNTCSECILDIYICIF